MMKHVSRLVAGMLFFALPLLMHAQRSCATMEVLHQMLKEDPTIKEKMDQIDHHAAQYVKMPWQPRVNVTIPVVFHVLWRTNAEKVTAAQLQSQLDVLNEDFQKLNADIVNVPADFQSVIGDCDISFCLAQQDPGGAATTGINYKSTTKLSWGTNDDVKKLSKGGIDPWNRDNYLNIWICNIGGGILGYAQFPGGPATTDGVVIDYRYVGRGGSAVPPFDKGRTGTHEVGHWLNLYHIWGDATCGNDQVSDTPLHNTANYGCPTHPHLSTCTGTPKEMFMNYMDYTDDPCMVMFSAGQAGRVQSCITGSRGSLQNSPGCNAPGGGGTCGTPTGLASSAITSSSATLTWSAVSGATSYNISYKPTASGTWTTTTSATNSKILTGLSASTQYDWKVGAVCIDAIGAESTNAQFTTAPANCTDIYEANNTKATSKSFTLNSNLTATISTGADIDWYKFNNTATQKNIRATMWNLPADYDMKLYRNNTLIATSENENLADEKIVYNNGTVATYYLNIYPWAGANSPNCYSWKVEISSSILSKESGEGSQAELIPVTLPEFIVAPNPNNGLMQLRLMKHIKGQVSVRILNIAGMEVFNQEYNQPGELIPLNLNANSGMYFIELKDEVGTFTQKVIIR